MRAYPIPHVALYGFCMLLLPGGDRGLGTGFGDRVWEQS